MNISQIISASNDHIQFQGFENYSIIGDDQKKNIAEKQKGVTGDLGYDQVAYISFINTAIAAATDVSPVDPTPHGLYFWVKTGAASPSGEPCFGRMSVAIPSTPGIGPGHFMGTTRSLGITSTPSPFPDGMTPQSRPQETFTQTISSHRSRKWAGLV